MPDPSPRVRGLYRRGDRWHFRRTIGGKQVRVSLDTSSLVEAEERALRILSGGGDPGAVRSRPASGPAVTDCLVAYELDMIRRGLTDHHRTEAIATLADLAGEAGIMTLDGWTPAATERALTAKDSKSTRTRNKALVYVRAFSRWLQKTGRWDHSLCRGVGAVRHVPVRVRRSLSPVELRALLDLAPEPRALVYRVAVSTGLRRSELGRLRRADLDLERGTVTIRAEDAKSRRPATLPVPESCAVAWRAWLADPYHLRGRALLSMEAGAVLPPVPGVRTWRLDCERAGVDWRDTGAGKLDFHALRVTFVSNLARAGVPFAAAVKLARHSDPKLTAAIYTRFAPVELADAAAKLDELLEGDKRDGRGRRGA